MQRAYLLAFLLLSCKDDPPTTEACTGDAPDFVVLVSALDTPLPADIVVTVEYGGGEIERATVPDIDGQAALFCDPSDRDGNVVTGAGGYGGVEPSGDGGDGAAQPGHVLEALRCELWTEGPATVTVETSLYATVERRLSPKKGKCTVDASIEIGPDDGGA